MFTATMTPPPDGRLDGAIHTWFSLTYSNCLVLDRARTQSMPDRWHAEMSRMLDQIRDAFAHVERAAEYVAVAGVEHEFGDLDDEQMRKAEVESNADTVHEDCEHPADDGLVGSGDEVWDCERENLRWYDWRGDEYDRHNYLTVPSETVDEAREQKRIVVHRSLLQSMPADWQERFVALLDAVPHVGDDLSDCYEIRCFDANGQRITDPVPHYNRGRTYVEPRLSA